MIQKGTAQLTDQAESQLLEDSAPLASLIINVENIQPYEHNPRHTRNPEFDRIRDSIQTNGLDQPLVITQRPQATDYIVHTGGNTRLMILKELYEETGNDRFSQVQCVFKPWNCESDVLLAHLRENDLRGSLTYIDKARAVHEARQFLTEDLGLKDISLRRLETELTTAGYRITNSGICLMMYAVERLWSLIPQALDAGMGRHQIERIRALERAARNLWQHHCSGNDSAFDEVFAILCRRYDGVDWDTSVLQGAIETEIAEEAETSIHTIRTVLDAELAGRKVVIPAFVPIKEPPPPNPHVDRNPVTPEVQDGNGESDIGLNLTIEAPMDPVDAAMQSGGDPHHPISGVSESIIDENNYGRCDLKSMRGRAWTLAARLSQRNGFGDLVMPLSDKGLGFVLRDVPDPVLADQLDEDALGQVCMLWWQLAACSEITFAPIASIVPILPADSILRRALENQDAELLFNSIWTLDSGHTGYRLWRLLSDQDWEDLLNLMDCYRRIRHMAAETGTAIWD